MVRKPLPGDKWLQSYEQLVSSKMYWSLTSCIAVEICPKWQVSNNPPLKLFFCARYFFCAGTKYIMYPCIINRWDLIDEIIYRWDGTYQPSHLLITRTMAWHFLVVIIPLHLAYYKIGVNLCTHEMSLQTQNIAAGNPFKTDFEPHSGDTWLKSYGDILKHKV